MTGPRRFGTCALLVLLAAAGLTGCKRSSESAVGAVGAVEGVGVRVGADTEQPPELIVLLQDLAANCQVTARGQLHPDRCRVSGLLRQLKQLESCHRSTWQRCDLLQGPAGGGGFVAPPAVRTDRQIRQLCANGSSSRGTNLRLPSQGAGPDQRPGHQAPPSPRIGAHGTGAWAYRRCAVDYRTRGFCGQGSCVRCAVGQRASDCVAGAQQGDPRPPAQRAAACGDSGFWRWPPMNPEERRQVCALLVPLMTDEEQMVAGNAAMRVASDCPHAEQCGSTGGRADACQGHRGTGLCESAVHGGRAL